MSSPVEKGERKGGASLSRTDLKDRYIAWQHHHRLSAADSLLKVLQNPLNSLLTWLVIGIALALPVGLNALLQNLDRLSEGWDSPAQISVLLSSSIDEEQGRSLGLRLADRPDVAEAIFVPREAALADFTRLSGFEDVLTSLDENPLPDVILVTPTESWEKTAASRLATVLADEQGVEEVVLDMEWLAKLQSISSLARRVILVIGGLLILGAILILGNTIRLAIENRREEVLVVKLVGGSNAFVRRPFLYTGLWFGVGGGLVAGLLVSAALWYLEEPVSALAGLYQSQFSLQGLGVMGVLNLVILGGFLGLIGAWLAVGKNLASIEPR